MAKILLRGVTGLTGITDSLVSFWTYNSKLPLRANRRESCEELGYILVLHVPMAYPNTAKQKVPLVYPLSTPVMRLDEKFDFSLAELGFRRSGSLERRNPTNT